ncbi:PAAR domain-containing protein [Caballeronia sp. BR00000012568055]|uniref:PAAR domain-containing protein n=1 Tax=Caballeronia sp. BR00000012568055 TaxID=2918761 RepID=UPI0023F71C34|nr:PAAR domain-containing protein [Caballeronia sp. BR00000012568055]
MENNKHNESIASVKIALENGTKYFFATLGSLTERGKCVTRATGTWTIAGHQLARVGDTVTYDDGNETTIINGAGAAAVNIDRSVALIGSSLNNGDRIVESLQERAGLFIGHGRVISGLFDPGYVAPDYAAGAA